MESSPESAITQDFNPFVPTVAPQGMGATGLIYEPLLQFDLAAPPKYYKWLATSYKWADGGKSITFTIRSGVKWNNGTPMTPADVVFTYDLVRKNTAINLAGLKISSVSASGNTVTLTFPTPQYTNLQQIAGVPILPQSVWGSAGNPATFTDATPVGTGPYMLKSFTPQGFTLTKNPHYWQASQVKVQNVYFPVYTSNTGALNALFSGQIDWTGQLHPRAAEAVRGQGARVPPLLGGAGQHQRADAEPEPVADQPAGRPAGDQHGREPQRPRHGGRGRAGEPGAERHRDHAAHVLRVERAGRSRRRSRPPTTRPRPGRC